MELNRVRENGTKVINTSCDDDKINACRIICYYKQYAKVDGVMVDLYTASAILKVYDNLSAKNRDVFKTGSIEKMAITAYRLLSSVK